MSRWAPIAIATIILLAVANVAAADPPGLKTLPIGSAAPDFALPGVDGRTYSLKDFAECQDPGRHLHLQPLPDGPGVRGPHRRSCTPTTRTRASPSSPSRPTTRRPSGSTSWATPTWATRSRT